MVDFKRQHPFEKRKEESTRIMAKYPDKLPLIVERVKNSDIEEINSLETE